MGKIKKILTLVILFSISIIAVFFLIREEKDQYASPDPGIIMGSECGFDYLSCCEEEPVCSFGQKCCVDPNDPNRNYCADECTCGAENEFCCQGNACQQGLICYLGNCQACGSEGEMCCPGENECEPGLMCHEGECLRCGLPGNPCCDGNCIATSSWERAGCFNGMCYLCGSKGLKACPGTDPCSLGHLFNNGVCYVCGDVNKPCCNEQAELGYDCDPKKGLICDLGFCRLP